MSAAPPDSYPAVQEAHRRGEAGDAELACAFVLSHVKARHGARWHQGDWRPPLPATPSAHEAVKAVAVRRLCRVPRVVSQALVAWAAGARPVDLYFHVPSPRDVLALQARGRRCVSLLSPGADDPLDFCLHDLCHLEKFVAESEYVSQVGFFSRFHDAVSAPTFAAFEAGFDEAWAKDRDYVTCDMNGSAIFLFAALKMKVKMAVRRRLGGGQTGPLDAAEERAAREVLADLFARMGLAGETVDAAFEVSTRRDAQSAAVRLDQWFEARGREVLGGCAS